MCAVDDKWYCSYRICIICCTLIFTSAVAGAHAACEMIHSERHGCVLHLVSWWWVNQYCIVTVVWQHAVLTRIFSDLRALPVWLRWVAALWHETQDGNSVRVGDDSIPGKLRTNQSRLYRSSCLATCNGYTDIFRSSCTIRMAVLSCRLVALYFWWECSESQGYCPYRVRWGWVDESIQILCNELTGNM